MTTQNSNTTEDQNTIKSILEANNTIQDKTKLLMKLERSTRHSLNDVTNKEAIESILSLNRESAEYFSLAMDLATKNAAFVSSTTFILESLLENYEKTIQTNSPNSAFLEVVITITKGKLFFEQYYNKALNNYFLYHYSNYKKTTDITHLEKSLEYLELIRLDDFSLTNYLFQLETILNKFKITLLLASLFISKNKPIKSGLINKLQLIYRKTCLMKIKEDLITKEHRININKYKLHYFILLNIHEYYLNKYLSVSESSNELSKVETENSFEDDLKLEYEKFMNSDFSGYKASTVAKLITESEQEESQEADNIIETCKVLLDLHNFTDNKIFIFLAATLCLASTSNWQKEKFLSVLIKNYRNILLDLYVSRNCRDKVVVESLDSVIESFKSGELIYFENSNLKNIYNFTDDMRDFLMNSSELLIENNVECLLDIVGKLFSIARLRLKLVVAEYNLYLLSKSISRIALRTIGDICCLNEIESLFLIKKLIKIGKLKARLNDCSGMVCFYKESGKEERNRIEILNETIEKVEEVSRNIAKEYRKAKMKTIA